MTSGHPLRPSSRRAQLSFEIACRLTVPLDSPRARVDVLHCKCALYRKTVKTLPAKMLKQRVTLTCEMFELLRKLVRVRISHQIRPHRPQLLPRSGYVTATRVHSSCIRHRFAVAHHCIESSRVINVSRSCSTCILTDKHQVSQHNRCERLNCH